MSDLQRRYEQALRDALAWKTRAQDLEEAIMEYALWEPGRRGHAAAHRRLMATVRDDDA